MNIKTDLTQLIGSTPMLELTNLQKKYNLGARIIAKLEYFNPLGSVKDRTALALISAGEKQGKIDRDTVVIEPTSGNTGIGLAFMCVSKGYRLILVMPDSVSVERRMLLGALGAELHLTPGADGMKGAIEAADKLHEEIGNSYIPMQFQNPANPEVHRLTTAQEIWEDTDGTVDIFVASFGTGGTVTGAGRGLKEHNPNIKVVGVEPAASAVVSGGQPGPHKIQGIGAGFIPEVLDVSIMDEVLTVRNEDALMRTEELARVEGLLVGISSGAALDAALEVAKRHENSGKTIVVMFPDTGERYLSMGVYGQ